MQTRASLKEGLTSFDFVLVDGHREATFGTVLLGILCRLDTEGCQSLPGAVVAGHPLGIVTWALRHDVAEPRGV